MCNVQYACGTERSEIELLATINAYNAAHEKLTPDTSSEVGMWVGVP